MRQWYVQFSENLFGPWSSSEVRRYIKSGKIPSIAYVSLEGEPNWLPILDMPDFFHSFAGEQLTMTVEEMPERHWIVLKTKTQSEYGQDGPFSTREILSLIASGGLEYSDRIWKPGFQNWERIGDLSPFIPSSLWTEKSSDKEAPLLPKVDSRELLASVARLEGKEDCVNLPPPEASGPDLVERKSLESVSSQEKIEEEAIKQLSFPMKKALTENASVEIREKLLPKNLPVSGILAGIKENLVKAFGVLCFLVVLGLLMKNFVSIEPNNKVQATEKIVSQLEKVSLRIVPVAMDSMRPRLELRSNYDRKDQVHIEILGRDDKILEHYRFMRSVSLPYEPGQSVSLNLTEENLPDGLFVVKAKLGNLNAEKEIFVGVNDIQFESKLKQFNLQKKKRKDLEEKILKSVRVDLEERTEEIRKASRNHKMTEVEWKSFLNSWQRKFYQSAHTEVRNFTAETRSHFVMAEEFEKLKRARLDLWKLSKELQFGDQKGREFSQSLDSIESDLKSL